MRPGADLREAHPREDHEGTWGTLALTSTSTLAYVTGGRMLRVRLRRRHGLPEGGPAALQASTCIRGRTSHL